MKICNLCPLINKDGKNCGVPGTQPCCSKCGCSLGLKLRAMESTCPHPDGPKWGPESTQNPTQNGSNIQTPGSQLP
jgi:hypothetical protein